MQIIRKFSMPVFWLTVVAPGLFVCGCGGDPPEIPGGTGGRIQAAETPLSDIFVQVYPDDAAAAQPLASSISDREGTFQLRTPQLDAPVQLEPGTYRATIESSGEIYLMWPREYADPMRTPLRFTVDSPEASIDLDVPDPAVGN